MRSTVIILTVSHELTAVYFFYFQSSAVEFFTTILDYDYGAAWYHLRELCDNDEVLEPPSVNHVHLEPIVGTPFEPKDKDYQNNIKLIFKNMVS